MTHTRQILVSTDAHPTRPGLDTAISRALLIRGSQGEVPETFRLHVSERIVAFGKQDLIAPGYGPAVASARRLGYLPVERLAGGRAAVFHEGTLAFSWMIPDADPRAGIHSRFRMLADLMVAAFGTLGISATVGEVPGEYCAGSYSVNLDGRWKVMGVGQRLARHAAHIGGVIVVYGAGLLREVLVPVYRDLGLEWNPETAGALDMAAPGITLTETGSAVLGELSGIGELTTADLDPLTLALAEELRNEHLSPEPEDAERR